MTGIKIGREVEAEVEKAKMKKERRVQEKAINKNNGVVY